MMCGFVRGVPSKCSGGAYLDFAFGGPIYRVSSKLYHGGEGSWNARLAASMKTSPTNRLIIQRYGSSWDSFLPFEGNASQICCA
jgi:hypothetical protein